jgi:hypothetical protein
MTETLLLEAWEDFDAVTGCRTLYLLGEAEIAHEDFLPVLRKKQLPGFPPTELLLELIPGNVPARKNIVELIYSEEMGDKKYYEAITVFNGNKVIAEITELERLAGV